MALWRTWWARLGQVLGACAVALGSCADAGPNHVPSSQALQSLTNAVPSWLDTAGTSPAQSSNGRLFVRPAALATEKSQYRSYPSRTSRFVSAAPWEGFSLGATATAKVRVPTTGGPAIDVSRLEATTSEGRLVEGMVLYPGAAAGVDAMVFATEHGVEDLWHLREPRSRWGYDLDLPRGWRIHTPSNVPGLAEVQDDRQVARLRVWARRAWDAEGRHVALSVSTEGSKLFVHVGEASAWPVVVDPEWTGTEIMAYPRYGSTLTPLASGKVLVVGGGYAGTEVCEVFNPETNTFSVTGSITHPRSNHLAFLLEDGRVLVVGGADQGAPVRSVETYDPSTGEFTTVGTAVGGDLINGVRLLGGQVLLTDGLSGSASLYDPATDHLRPIPWVGEARYAHSATLLPSGKVLVAGGAPSEHVPVAETWVFDPAHQAFSPGPTLSTPRLWHAAHGLPDGRVLLAGGIGAGFNEDIPTEIVNVDTQSTSPGLRLQAGRRHAASAPLPDGRLLIAGGISPSGGARDDTEIVDPESGTVRQGPTLNQGRYSATAALLPDGRVLVVGPDATAEWLPPLWSLADRPVLGTGRGAHTATRLSSGEVVLAGGAGDTSVEVFNPANGTIRSAGNMVVQRTWHTATLLEGDRVLLMGGTTPSVEIYDATTGSSKEIEPLAQGRFRHTATQLPDGRVIVAGGCESRDIEAWDPVTQSASVMGQLQQARYSHTATRFPDGRILIAGGYVLLPKHKYLFTTEWLDPSTGTTTAGPALHADGHAAALVPGGSLLVFGPSGVDELQPGASAFELVTAPIGRGFLTATVLPTGKILLTGGQPLHSTAPSAMADLFDPVQRTLQHLPDMSSARVGHSATRLEDGRVVIVGGSASAFDPTQQRATLEIFDAGTAAFSRLDAPTDFRSNRTAKLLPSGKVLLAGGTSTGTTYCEIWDRETQKPHPTAKMRVGRTGHTATTLDTGAVLIVGGESWDGPTRSAEVFEPAAGQFRDTGETQIARAYHTATRLPSGDVLVVGGSDDPTCELFSPSAGTFRTTGALRRARSRHAAVLTSEGRVLVAGGASSEGEPVLEIESFDPFRGVFELLQTPALVGGPTRGAWDGLGTALFAGPDVAYAIDAATTQLRPLLEVSVNPFATFPLPTGGAAFCGEAGGKTCCVTATGGRGDAMLMFETPGGSGGSTAIRLHTGEVWLNTQAIPSGAISLLARTTRDDALRPTLLSAPDRVRIGVPATLKGTRLSSPATTTATPTHPMPGVVPSVLFIPAEADTPVVFPVERWSDTQVDFTPVPTGFHGPGWLQVSVEGVQSHARFVVLEPSPLGAPCKTGGECASGFCVESVCCDSPCDQACFSCLAAHKASGENGSCGTVSAGQDPKAACADEPAATCGTTGVCDAHGACERYPESTPCSASRLCLDGVCTPTLGEPCRTSIDCATGQVCNAAGVCGRQAAQQIVADPGACASGPRPNASRSGIVSAILALSLALSRSRRRTTS